MSNLKETNEATIKLNLLVMSLGKKRRFLIRSFPGKGF